MYVDEIILTGDDMTEGELLQWLFVWEFENKNLGNLIYFLGIEVAKLRKGIF